MTLEASDAWSFAIPIQPTVECVDAVGSDRFSVRFGYENSAGLSVVIPRGEQNQLLPAPLVPVEPPEQLLASGSTGAFRATFAVGETLTWQLLGQQVAAPGVGTPACQSDTPVSGTPSVPRNQDGPRGLSIDAPAVAAFQVLPGNGFFSNGFDDPAPSAASGDQNNTGPDIPPPSPTLFKVKRAEVRVILSNLNITETDGCGAHLEPYLRSEWRPVSGFVHEPFIETQARDFGSCSLPCSRPAEEVAVWTLDSSNFFFGSAPQIDIQLRLKEDDDGFCGPDDKLLNAIFPSVPITAEGFSDSLTSTSSHASFDMSVTDRHCA